MPAGTDFLPVELAALLSCGAHQSDPWRQVFPGQAAQVSQVRRFVRRCLAPSGPAEDAALLTTELAANAIQHTASGDGGTFEVIICRHAGTIRISVADAGAAGPPAVGPRGRLSLSGRGLGIVAALARDWGHHGGPYGRVVWFELDAA
jgi:anti-sigma regulatory factor (Ser/Thr protein kinase)